MAVFPRRFPKRQRLGGRHGKKSPRTTTLYLAFEQDSVRRPEENEILAKMNLRASLRFDPASFWAHQVNYFYFHILPDSADLAKGAIAFQQDNWLAWMWYED